MGHSARTSLADSSRDGTRGVLQGDVLLKGGDVLLAAEHEQVPDLLEIDLPAGREAKLWNASRLRCAIWMFSVSENWRARHPQRGWWNRTKLVAFDKDEIHPCFGKMEGGTDSDHAAADDHHGSTAWKDPSLARAHRRPPADALREKLG